MVTQSVGLVVRLWVAGICSRLWVPKSEPITHAVWSVADASKSDSQSEVYTHCFGRNSLYVCDLQQGEHSVLNSLYGIGGGNFYGDRTG